MTHGYSWNPGTRLAAPPNASAVYVAEQSVLSADIRGRHVLLLLAPKTRRGRTERCL